MTNEEKAFQLSQKHYPDEDNVLARDIWKSACMEMAEWKDEQLDIAIDKALERNCEFLKKGKITQYGFDMAFVTIQNIRAFLSNKDNK